jgi:hypothetical protein
MVLKYLKKYRRQNMAIFIRSKESGERKIFWQSHLKECKKSGLSQREYCNKNGLCLSTLTNWKRKFEKSEVKEISFVKIDPGIEGQKSAGSVEIILSGNIKLRVDEDVNPEKIALLVNALKGAA